MKRFLALLIAATLFTQSLTLSASAADGAHSATKCYHIDSGTCEGNNHVDKHSTKWKCCDCSRTCTDTTYNCVLCGTPVYGTYNGECPRCGGSLGYVDNSYRETLNAYYRVSTHTYSHSYTCSSSYPCQKGHSAYRTVAHYYCTTHGWVGTDSKCPGLAVSPTPTSMSLYYGQTQKITPNPTPTTATVTYTTNNSNIATVSPTGLVSSENKGSTTIVVTATL